MIEYKGECPCGVVKFKLIGKPLFTQHCHCSKCREVMTLSNINTDKVAYSFTAAYMTPNLIFSKGQGQLKIAARNTSDLFLCHYCNSLIYGISQDPVKQAGIGINVQNVHFLNNKLPLCFLPDKHIWYQDRIIDVNDHLPKYKDTPIEQFGTGELVM